MILEVIEEAAAALQANPYFANIPVVSVNEGDPGNKVDQYLAKVGIGVVLGTSALRSPSANIQGGGSLYYDNVVFHATIFENVQVNRGTGGTNKWAPTVAETVAVLLHWHKPDGVSECLICTDGPTLIPYKDDTERKLLIYDVAFKTQGGIGVSPVISKAATPVAFVVNNGNGTSTVTLSCSTPHAQIWYRTDGSFPSPLNPDNTPSAPYTAPFVVTNGSTRLQARAYLAGYLASDMLKQNI